MTSLGGSGTQWYLTVRFNLCDENFDMAGVLQNYFVAWFGFFGVYNWSMVLGGTVLLGVGVIWEFLLYLCYFAFT